MKFLLGLALAAAAWTGSARAEDIGCTSTTFHILGANDKICITAFDDPKVPGVTCHVRRPVLSRALLSWKPWRLKSGA